MPPLALASLLHQALPWLSVDGRAVVNTLVCDNGRVGSAQALCQRVGLRSRFQLNRLLRREGLPPYEELSGWVCVFYWMVRGDTAQGRAALRPLVPQTRIEIASAYRLVRRVTGHCWTELRRAGTSEVLRWFRDRTRPPRPIRQPRSSRPSVRAGGVPHRLTTSVTTGGPQSRPSRLVLPGGPYGIAVRGHEDRKSVV